MSYRAGIPVELRGQVFRGSSAVERGLLTKAMLRGSAWLRLLPDTYADARWAEGFDPFALRCLAAAARMPPGAVLSGRAAARVEEVPIGDPDDRVLVLVPPGVRMHAVPGLTVRHVTLPDPDVNRDRRIPVTTPLRTAVEIARAAPLLDAVADLDLFLHRNYVRVEELSGYIHAHPRSRVTPVLRYADHRAESPQESRLRVKLLLAGLPTPVLQHEVWPCGRYRRLDLAWPDFLLAVEYDGIHHAGFAQLTRDRARQDDLTEAGWTVFHVTAPQLADPIAVHQLVDRLRRHLC